MKWYEKTESRGGVVNIKIDHAKALKYLNDTDWYIVRETETGTITPAEVLTKRAEARLVLNG